MTMKNKAVVRVHLLLGFVYLQVDFYSSRFRIQIRHMLYKEFFFFCKDLKLNTVYCRLWQNVLLLFRKSKNFVEFREVFA